jgi:hypothetical protein
LGLAAAVDAEVEACEKLWGWESEVREEGRVVLEDELFGSARDGQ